MTGPALRRTLHAASGAVLLLALHSDGLLRLGMTSAAAAAIGIEILRLRSEAFGTWLARAVPVFRPGERARPSGGVWLAIGYAAAVWFPMPAPIIGVACAALADPAASLVGTRWGRGSSKSWPGTVAAMAVGAVVAAIIVGRAREPGWTVVPVAGVGTAALERWVGPLDDNLVVAPGVAFLAWLFA